MQALERERERERDHEGRNKIRREGRMDKEIKERKRGKKPFHKHVICLGRGFIRSSGNGAELSTQLP
jgi:hypothetical protein